MRDGRLRRIAAIKSALRSFFKDEGFEIDRDFVLTEVSEFDADEGFDLNSLADYLEKELFDERA